MGLRSALDEVIYDMQDTNKIVIIIDQLDTVKALNPTPKQIYYVIKELIEKLTHLPIQNPVNIILSNRTFDLQQDSHLASQTKDYERVNIRELEPNEIKNILAASNINFDNLSKSTHELLKIFFNLKLFIKIYQNAENKNFTSKFDLIQELLRQLETKNTGTVAFLKNFSERISSSDSTGLSSRLFIEQHTISEALLSEGIIKKINNQLSFTHQSYYDYFNSYALQESLLEDVNSIIAWLGDKTEQSLNKASILKDCLLNIYQHTDIIIQLSRLILENDFVRYHIKYTVLNFLKTIDEPNIKLRDYIFTLALNPEYENMLMYFLLSQKTYFNDLVESDLAADWLENGKYSYSICEQALKNPQDYIDLIKECVFAYAPDTAYQIISYQVEKLPEELFETFILNTKEEFEEHHYPHLKSETELINISKLIARLLKDGKYTKKEYSHHTDQIVYPINLSFHLTADKTTLEYIEQIDLDVISECFNILIEAIVDITNRLPHEIRYSHHTGLHSIDRHTILDNAYVLSHMLGNRLILFDEKLIVSIFKKHLHRLTPYVKILFFELFELIKSEVIADEIIRLFTHYLPLHDGIYVNSKNHYLKTGQMLQNLSSKCSQTTLEKLEQKILEAKPYMDEHIKSYSYRRKSYFNKHFGEPQFLLIPTLPQSRISDKTKEVYKVYERKFGIKDYGKIISGFTQVVSPIEANAHKFNIKTWISIFKNNQLNKDNRWTKNQKTGKYYESSIETFSRSFCECTQKHPEKYLNLLLKLDFNPPQAYVESAFHAVRYPDKESEPINITTLISFIKRYFDFSSTSICMDFCEIISKHYTPEMPTCFINAMSEIALNGQTPEMNQDPHYNLDYNDAEASDFETDRHSHSRSTAFYYIGIMIFNDHTMLETFNHIIRAGMYDHHRTVRMAVMHAILPIINFDKEKCFELGCELLEKDFLPAASHSGIIFINNIARKKARFVQKIYYQIIKRGKKKEIRKIANVIAFYHSHYNNQKRAFNKCLKYNSDSKQGLLEGLIDALPENYFIVLPKLITAFEDESIQQDEFTLQRLSLKNMPLDNIHDLISKIAKGEIHSSIFPSVIYALGSDGIDYNIFSEHLLACIDIFNQNKVFPRAVLYRYSNQIPKILLDLYQQHENAGDEDKVNYILDIWDAMLIKEENPFMSIHDKLMQEMN